MKVENAQEKPDDDSRQGTHYGQEKETVDNKNLIFRISAQKSNYALLYPPEGKCAEQHGGIKDQRIFTIFCFAQEPDSKNDNSQVDTGGDDFSRKIYQNIFFHYIGRVSFNKAKPDNFGGEKMNTSDNLFFNFCNQMCP